MGVVETSLGRVRRRRWLTGLLVGGIGLTVLAVGLTYWRSARRATPQERLPPSPAADVQQQRTGLTFTRSDGPRPVFTVHAARSVSYQESKSTVLEDVTVQLFGPKGDRGDILTTERCEYNPQSGDFFGSGPVQIELSPHSTDIPGSGVRGKQRIWIETSKVSFQKDAELAETEQPVKFRVGSTASGTALGMLYATRDGWLELEHDVVMDMVQGTAKAPRPPLHLTASALRYEKEDGRIRLSGPVNVADARRHGVADAAVIQLDAHNRVSLVNLEGQAKVFDPLRGLDLTAGRVQGIFDAASGQLRHLTAEDNVTGETHGRGSISHLAAQRVDLDLGGNHPQPVRGSAKGNVHMSVESQAVLNLADKAGPGKGPERKTLTANQVDFTFRTQTHGLKDAETVGPGTLVVTSANSKVGQKVIKAGQFLMSFDAQSRMESLRGLAPTQVVFRPPADAPPGTPIQQSEADHLEAVFDTKTQILREVRQSGDFQFRDGVRQGSSDQADYDAQTETMLLLGHPQVWDPDSHIKAEKMSIDMRTNTSTAEGKVQATHLSSPSAGKAPATSPTLPTNVLADKMVAQRQSQIVRYEGHVRAWQGTDVVESSALNIYRAQKRLTSGSEVVTSFLQPAAMVSGAASDPHAARPMRPVTIRAGSLEYLDQGRRARYSGNVSLMTESTTVRSDRLDVYFSPSDTTEGSQVERAVAEGHVRVTQPGRVGTGEHGEYFAGPGKIVLTGGNPTLLDAEKGSTTGQRLTFFLHDDRLFVDGGDHTPSVSRHRVAP